MAKITVEAKPSNLPPVYVNLVDVNRLGTEIFLDFGIYDAVKVVKEAEVQKKEGKSEDEIEIKAEGQLTMRVVLDYTTFGMLRERLNLLYEKIKDMPEFAAQGKWLEVFEVKK